MDTGPRSPQILETLLQKRQILLQGEVDADIQTKISRFILYLNAIDNSPITLFIDTGGGRTELSLIINDSIQQSVAEIHGIVIGDAFSAGFRILQSCKKRMAYPNARLMFHATAVSLTRCDSDDWEISLKKTLILHEEQLRIYAKRSNQTVDQLRIWSKAEKRFTSEEALQEGFLDEVIQPRIIC